MGFLDKFKKKPESAKAFKIHPMARQAHPVAFSAWAAGGTVAALNPDTNRYEVVDLPIFAPEVNYIVTAAPKMGNGFMPPTPKAMPRAAAPVAARAPQPAPVAQAMPLRGDIWVSNSGNQYLVLGNKHDLIPNYNALNDPDKLPLVVVRYDEGMKTSLSHRTTMGSRISNSGMDLTARVGRTLLNAVTTRGQYKVLYARKNDSIVVDVRTFETKAIAL